MSFHPRTPIEPDAATIAAAAAIVAPFIAAAYAQSGRSTAAGLAKALDVLQSLAQGPRND